MLDSEPPSKAAFKKFINNQIRSSHNDWLKSKIQKSSSLRLIHPDDFDFERKHLSPVISSASTKREVIALKLTVYHLIGEYKCGANLFRIRLKNSPQCEYCGHEDDNSEHAILQCGILDDNSRHADLIQDVIALVSEDKKVPADSIKDYYTANKNTFAQFLLNPISNGNSNFLKISYKSKICTNIILTAQEVILNAHNLRSKAQKICEVEGRYGKQTRSHRGSHHRGRGRHLPSQGRSSKFNKITRYFKSTSSKISKSDRDHEALSRKPIDDELERGKKQPSWLSNAKTSDQILLGSIAPKIQASITCTLNAWGRFMWSRHWTLRLHHHDAEDNLILWSSYRHDVLNSIKMMLLDQFLPEAVNDLCGHLPMISGVPPNKKWDEPCPVAIYYSDWPEDLHCHLLQKSDVMTHIFITIDNDAHANPQNLERIISQRDFQLFTDARERYQAYRSESLEDWARIQMISSASVVTFTDKDNTSEELFNSLSAFSQLTYPGKSIIQSEESGIQWSVRKDEKLCTRKKNGEWMGTNDPKAALLSLMPRGDGCMKYLSHSLPLFPTYQEEGNVKIHMEMPRRRAYKDLLERALNTSKIEKDDLKTELMLINRTAMQLSRHNENLMRQKTEVEKRLSDTMCRPLSGFHLAGEEEKIIEAKVSEVLHRLVDTKKSLETLRWLKEADDDSPTNTGVTFGGTQIKEIPDIDDIATLRKAEAKLGELNQKLKEEKEWLRGERVSSTPNVVARLKPQIDSSISSTATSGDLGSSSAQRGSPGAIVKNPVDNTSFKFGNHDGNASVFQFGVKQGDSDCPATFLKKKRTIQALVTTTYPDGTQKKAKEAVSEDYFIGKIEAKKLSSAATQDQGTEVLRTDNEVDQEADLTDGGVSGIVRLNISSEVTQEPPLTPGTIMKQNFKSLVEATKDVQPPNTAEKKAGGNEID